MADSTIVVRFFEGARKRVKLNCTYAVGAMVSKAKARCEDLISARDHTLADLRRLGYPYAKRKPANPHDPPVVVHVQNGNLISGLQQTPPKGNSEGVSASVINTCEEDVWIQEGTPTMIARPYMDWVREHYADQILQAGKDEFLKRGGFTEEQSA